MQNKYITVFITTRNAKEAEKISASLLNKKLIACANVIKDVSSKFFWNGKVENQQEALIIAKTRKDNFRKLISETKRIHSYKVPEIIAMPITYGNKDYLNWIDDSLKGL